MYLKNWSLIFVAMIVAAFMAIPASADDMDGVDQYKSKVDKYKGSVDQYKGSVDNLKDLVQQEQQRTANERADLESRERQIQQQQQQYAPAPVIAVPVPVPSWGWSYYRYYDYGVGNWIFTRIWCQRNWRAPVGWISVSAGEQHHFRHFSQGRVDGGRVVFNRQPVPRLQHQQLQARIQSQMQQVQPAPHSRIMPRKW